MRTALQANKTVIIPGSMATPNDLTFTVGQITWTTDFDDFIAMTTEEARIQSASTTASPALATAPTMVDLASATPASSSATPTTRRPLPPYKGRQIDNTDLLDFIYRVGTKLAETLALVSSIQNQPTVQVTTTQNRSTRQLGPVVLHDLVWISWSRLLLKGAPFIADQPPQRVSGSSSAKP